MKRSEMIQLMAEHHLGLFPKEDPIHMGADPELFEEIKKNMDRLLYFLEYKGMKPPVADICPVLFTTKYVWEPEQ